MNDEKEPNRYSQLLEAIFLKHYEEGILAINFDRSEISQVSEDLKIVLPKNLGDVIYSFRYRTPLPVSITNKAPEGFEWIIRPVGRAKYQFALVRHSTIIPSTFLVETKIPDATPRVISRYALSDEQAPLAILRYNRLIDIFTGLTCYSLQSHLRTTLKDGSQVETDEIYVGLDKRGVHYVLPVQAKGKRDKLGIVQIEQDFRLCESKFLGLACKVIAALFMTSDLIALFEFESTKEGVKVASEKHYRLVKADELTQSELEGYRTRLE
jgi:hypothetical protein